MRTEQAIVRHWQLVLLAYTFSLLVGAVPTATAPPADGPPAPTPTPPTELAAPSSPSTEPLPTGGVGHNAAPGPELAVPTGTAAALLATLVAQRPTARAGRAPRPSRPLASP